MTIRSNLTVRFALGAALAFVALAAPVDGQWMNEPEDTVRVRTSTEYRWLPEGAHPGGVRFSNAGEALTLVPLRGGRDYRSLAVEAGRTKVRLTMDRRNRPWMTDVDTWYSFSVHDGPDDRSLGSQLEGFHPGGAQMNHLPESRAWEFTVALPGRELVDGVRWTDTVSVFAAPAQGISERYEGVFAYEVEGDSAVLGRPMPRVRFHAEVTYESHREVTETARPEPMRVQRQAAGRVGGWFLLDTVLNARVAGRDSVRLAGGAILTLEDGRVFSEPVTYEATRRWMVDDSASQAARLAEWERFGGGMLIPPAEPTPGLVLSDTQVESLWDRFAQSRDPRARAGFAREIQRATGLNVTEFAGAAAPRLLAVGDTAPSLPGITGSRFRGRITAEVWDLYRPFLDDPGRLWRLGIVPRWSYTELARGMLRASPVLNRDPDSWVCAPEICETMLADMEASPEARLREVALVGRFARDPAGYWAEVLEAHSAGATHLGEAVQMGRGVGAIWPAAPKTPVPEAGAHWHDWLAWMGGEIRRENSHRMALTIYEARTGRDPLDDLEQRWPGLEGDSARLILGTVLRDHGRLPPMTAEEVHQDLTKGSPALRAAARRGLGYMPGTQRILPAAEARAFLEPLLDSMLASGTPPWAPLEPGDRMPTIGQGFHGVRDVPVYLVDQGHDSLLIAALADARGLSTLTRDEARSMEPRVGRVMISLEPVRRIGDLAQVDWGWSVWSDRPDDYDPVGYAGGGSLWLAWHEGQWWAVTWTGWIT